MFFEKNFNETWFYAVEDIILNNGGFCYIMSIAYELSQWAVVCIGAISIK